MAVFTSDMTPGPVNRVAEGELVGTMDGFADSGRFGIKFAVMSDRGMKVPGTFDIVPRISHVENARLFYPDRVLPAIDGKEIKANCE